MSTYGGHGDFHSEKQDTESLSNISLDLCQSPDASVSNISLCLCQSPSIAASSPPQQSKRCCTPWNCVVKEEKQPEKSDARVPCEEPTPTAVSGQQVISCSEHAEMNQNACPDTAATALDGGTCCQKTGGDVQDKMTEDITKSFEIVGQAGMTQEDMPLNTCKDQQIQHSQKRSRSKTDLNNLTEEGYQCNQTICICPKIPKLSVDQTVALSSHSVHRNWVFSTEQDVPDNDAVQCCSVEKTKEGTRENLEQKYYSSAGLSVNLEIQPSESRNISSEFCNFQNPHKRLPGLAVMEISSPTEGSFQKEICYQSFKEHTISKDCGSHTETKSLLETETEEVRETRDQESLYLNENPTNTELQKENKSQTEIKSQTKNAIGIFDAKASNEKLVVVPSGYTHVHCEPRRFDSVPHHVVSGTAVSELFQNSSEETDMKSTASLCRNIQSAPIKAQDSNCPNSNTFQKCNIPTQFLALAPQPGISTNNFPSGISKKETELLIWWKELFRFLEIHKGKFPSPNHASQSFQESMQPAIAKTEHGWKSDLHSSDLNQATNVPVIEAYCQMQDQGTVNQSNPLSQYWHGNYEGNHCHPQAESQHENPSSSVACQLREEHMDGNDNDSTQASSEIKSKLDLNLTTEMLTRNVTRVSRFMQSDNCPLKHGLLAAYGKLKNSEKHPSRPAVSSVHRNDNFSIHGKTADVHKTFENKGTAVQHKAAAGNHDSCQQNKMSVRLSVPSKCRNEIFSIYDASTEFHKLAEVEDPSVEDEKVLLDLDIDASYLGDDGNAKDFLFSEDEGRLLVENNDFDNESDSCNIRILGRSFAQLLPFSLCEIDPAIIGTETCVALAQAVQKQVHNCSNNTVIRSPSSEQEFGSETNNLRNTGQTKDFSEEITRNTVEVKAVRFTQDIGHESANTQDGRETSNLPVFSLHTPIVQKVANSSPDRSLGSGKLCDSQRSRSFAMRKNYTDKVTYPDPPDTIKTPSGKRRTYVGPFSGFGSSNQTVSSNRTESVRDVDTSCNPVQADLAIEAQESPVQEKVLEPFKILDGQPSLGRKLRSRNVQLWKQSEPVDKEEALGGSPTHSNQGEYSHHPPCSRHQQLRSDRRKKRDSNCQDHVYGQARRLLRQICYLKSKEETLFRAAIRFQQARLQVQEHHSMLFVRNHGRPERPHIPTPFPTPFGCTGCGRGGKRCFVKKMRMGKRTRRPKKAKRQSATAASDNQSNHSHVTDPDQPSTSRGHRFRKASGKGLRKKPAKADTVSSASSMSVRATRTSSVSHDDEEEEEEDRGRRGDNDEDDDDDSASSSTLSGEEDGEESEDSKSSPKNSAVHKKGDGDDDSETTDDDSNDPRICGFYRMV